MNLFKLSTTLSSLVLSGGILYTYTTGNVYSGLSYSVLVAAAMLLFSAWYSSDGPTSSITPYVASIVALAVLYRTYLFSYPMGLIGTDPYTYAYQIERTMRAGSVDAIQLSFYSDASAFISFSAMFGLMSGLPAPETLIIYPAIVGTVIVLAAVVLTTYVVPGRGLREGVIAGIIATVATATIHHAYVPVAQTLAVVLWGFFVFLSVRYYEFRSKRAFLLAVLALIALVSTHKLPLLIVFATLATFVSFTGIREVARRRRQRKFTRLSRTHRFGLTLTLLSAMFLYFQWAYVTDFIIAVVSTATAVFSTGTSVSPPLATPTAAVEPQSEAVGILLRRAHGLVLLPIGGLAWLFVLYDRRTVPAALILLSASAASIGFLVLSAFNPGTTSTSSPLRYLFFVEPVLIPIVAAVLGRVSVRRWAGVLSLALVVVLLISQVYSVPAIPDHPGGPREYLTTQEIEGKEFGYTHAAGPIYADWYLTVAGPQQGTNIDDPQQYRSLEGQLLNGTVAGRGYEYIVLRTNVDIYRTKIGLWQLTWNPEATLDESYSRVYANGDLSLYANASASTN